MSRLLAIRKISRFINAIFCFLRIFFGYFRVSRYPMRSADRGFTTDWYQDRHAVQHYFFSVSHLSLCLFSRYSRPCFWVLGSLSFPVVVMHPLCHISLCFQVQSNKETVVILIYLFFTLEYSLVVLQQALYLLVLTDLSLL